MRFDTKIAIAVREDLEQWQKLNVTAFLASAIAFGAPETAGKPYEDAQNRKIAARVTSLIHRGPQGVIRMDPKNHSAYTYPVQTKDPSLGAPFIFSQIKKKEETGYIISPAPYDVAKFEKPSWMK